ncbi:MAG: hypothetical protein CBD27_07240 [Rhodospirillaceae bacterium TMED167]|nr:cobalt transporter [Rhodospirillaceae bacterium]OUW26991.1 MAG: hypothetical protein CBD27_07240 [Rhodospirillaceae bacterium TMED167]
MLYRLIVSGLISGAIAGVVATVFHLLLVEPLIFAAEQFEGQEPAVATTAVEMSHDHANSLTHVHAGGAAPHAHETAPNTPEAGGTVHIHQDGSTHVHEAWEPADGVQRSGLTLVANILIGIAYGTLLATALTLHGHGITIQQGAIWGIAGYLCFNFLPALGLPPEVPGAAAADLFPRQVWWLATAFVSALGLAFLAFGSLQLWKPAGLILLIAPHVFGAPHAPAGAVGTAPPELASHFVVNTLFSGAMMWLALGIAMAFMLQRLDARRTVAQPAT